MIDKIKQLLSPEASVGAKLTVISLFLGKAFERAEDRLVSLEERQLQRGEKGERGEKGPQGDRGKDGKHGRDGIDGKNGLDGKDGVGKAGKHGVGVKDVTIAADNHLVVKLTDGKEIDVGDLELVMGKSTQHIISNSLTNNQVTVSATAPANPSLNDLWYDIS